mgnify:CR=1 FL=1
MVIQKILAAIGLIVIILFFIGVFAPDEQYDVASGNKVYKVEEDKNVLVDISECELPYETVGIRCCIKDDNIPTWCQDEFLDFEKKIVDSAEKEKLTTGGIIRNNEFDFSFKIPKDYLIAENTKAGGISVPYRFVAYGEKDEDAIWFIDKFINTSLYL